MYWDGTLGLWVCFVVLFKLDFLITLPAGSHQWVLFFFYFLYFSCCLAKLRGQVMTPPLSVLCCTSLTLGHFLTFLVLAAPPNDF